MKNLDQIKEQIRKLNYEIEILNIKRNSRLEETPISEITKLTQKRNQLMKQYRKLKAGF